MQYRKLGRTSPQRKAMIRSLVTQLLWHEKIKTTEDEYPRKSGVPSKKPLL